VNYKKFTLFLLSLLPPAPKNSNKKNKLKPSSFADYGTSRNKMDKKHRKYDAKQNTVVTYLIIILVEEWDQCISNH
jgi:hypothetical protein